MKVNPSDTLSHHHISPHIPSTPNRLQQVWGYKPVNGRRVQTIGRGLLFATVVVVVN
ncbi:hypothetical protein HanHA89_Chr16g0681921 [Helianthus annuus]|nr:hypothetical protein HanHA89_Chr16g0681921 [Helianthus annuus]